jgi:tRNA A37 threonylcarbamoyladenosine modification protein TsaB
MKLIISINDNKVKAILLKRGKAVDEEGFDLDNNLSEKLLPTIDKLLKRHKTEPKDLEKAELKAKVPDSYTTYRIAKAVVDALNWARG